MANIPQARGARESRSWHRGERVEFGAVEGAGEQHRHYDVQEYSYDQMKTMLHAEE